MPSANQAKAILSGDADIAFMRKLPMTAENVESRLLLDEEIDFSREPQIEGAPGRTCHP